MPPPSFTEQPLEFALFEGEPDLFRNYFANLSPDERIEVFSSVTYFYTPTGETQKALLFSLSKENQSLLEEEISEEELNKRLEEAIVKRNENEKKYSESIRNTKNEKPVDTLNKNEPEKKSKTWSWLKI